MARNARGYRHDHRVLRRKRGEYAFSLAKAKAAEADHCMECWAAKFRCPCCGPCVDAMVMTTKCCLFCGMHLIPDLPPVCRYHAVARTADSRRPADTTDEGDTMSNHTITEKHTDGGVAYELHTLAADHKYAARIHVMDVDSGNVVSNTFYREVAKAEAAYRRLITAVKLAS